MECYRKAWRSCATSTIHRANPRSMSYRCVSLKPAHGLRFLRSVDSIVETSNGGQSHSPAPFVAELQAVGLILIFLVGFGVPAGSVLCFFIPSLRRRLQEHSRLPKNYIEHQPGYYLVRDQHWSRFTMCRQFKPGSAKVVARQGGQPLTVSYERFWLSVEMLWKLSLLLLPLAVSDREPGFKYIPGAISTFIMFVAQSVRTHPAGRLASTRFVRSHLTFLLPICLHSGTAAVYVPSTELRGISRVLHVAAALRGSMRVCKPGASGSCERCRQHHGCGNSWLHGYHVACKLSNGDVCVATIISR